MTFALNPVSKVEIRSRTLETFTNITDYVIKDSTVDITVGLGISGGGFIFDKDILSVLPNIGFLDEVKVTIGDENGTTHIYTGLLRDKFDTNKDDTLGFEHRSYAILASDRHATEVFREDAGTGDPAQAFRNLVTTYLTELNFDITSIPNTGSEFEDFKNYRLQNAGIKEAFDFIADYLNRIWYVDQNKKIWLIEKTFEDTGYTLETGTSGNIIGDLVVATDLTKWANYVEVDGKVFEVGTEEEFTATAGQTEFELAERPFQVTVKLDDTIQSGSITGTPFSDDADYIINPDKPSVTFASGLTGGEKVLVEYKVHSKIHDEQEDSGSRTTLGYTKNKKIINDNIDTQEKATNIALNYLTVNSIPTEIYIGTTVWNENVQPLKSLTLKDNISPRSINKKVNVIEASIIFGDRNFEIRFKLNDFNFTSIDLYEDLVNRVKRLEFNSRDSGQQIAKYIFFGADNAVSINNLHIGSEGICNAFTLDHADTGLDDATVYLDGCDGSAGLLDEGEVAVMSLDNTFIEDFFAVFYKGSNGGNFGGPDWDITNKRLKMNSSSDHGQTYTTYQDFNIFHKRGVNIKSIRLENVEEIWGNDKIRYFVKSNGVNYEEMDNFETFSLSNLGMNAELRVVFEGKGGSDTYINQVRAIVTEV